MGDIFKEQLVKKKPTTRDMMIRVGLVALVVVIMLVVMSIPGLQGFIPFILAAVIFGAYFSMTFLKVEYEYILTNGILDIDIIYNQSRRKRLFSGSVRDFEIMAQINDKTRMGDFKSAAETKDYSSGVHGAGTYAFLTSYKSKNTKFIIEPNENMLSAFSKVLPPRKFFWIR